jgi:predicted LPLAT superfamily acyltransferase
MAQGLAKVTTSPTPKPTIAHWASLGEHTFVWGIKLLFQIYLLLGRLPFLVCLYPVVMYYWATRRSARQASLDYLQKLHATKQVFQQAPGWRETLRHFLSFADTILDKLLAMRVNIDLDAIKVVGHEGLDALIAQGRGAVIVTGHVGCMELCRVSAERQRGVRLNILVHTIHAARFNRLLQGLNPNSPVQLIQVTEISPATAILLAEKVKQGEFVAIAGDRVPVHQSMTVTARFLGHDAQWPVGPYVLAALLKCPLYAMACVRERRKQGFNGNYVLHTRCLGETVVLPRKERALAMAAYAQQFASWLETIVEQSPMAWFNFFCFWQQGTAVAHIEKND